MYAAADDDLPNIPFSSSGLNSILETVSPTRILHSVSARSRSSGDGGLGSNAGGHSSAHGGDCSPIFSDGREQNLELLKETNLGHNAGRQTSVQVGNRSPRVSGKGKQKLEASTERTTKNIDYGDLAAESSASSPTLSPSKVKIEPKELLPFLTSFHPDGQPKFKLISQRSNGRLTKFKVPVPVEERRTVLQSYRSNGKLSISLSKYSDQEEEEAERKEDTSGSREEE